MDVFDIDLDLQLYPQTAIKLDAKYVDKLKHCRRKRVRAAE
jgi:hypothetical protein